MLVLVLLGLVIRAHGCEQQYVGQPLEAASTATAAASAAAQRSMDRVRGSGLPLASDRCLMAALCFVLISEFWTLESRDVVELAYASCPRHPNGNGRLGRRMYDVVHRKGNLMKNQRGFFSLYFKALNGTATYNNRAVLLASRASALSSPAEPTRRKRARETAPRLCLKSCR